MDLEPTPDHYKALGVDNKADAATIKSTYRKLVLKCHPDKVTDPALKEQKQEEFHQIQQAYECLSDEQKRSAYDTLLTVEKLRREKAARGPAPRDRNARFDVPTPSGARYTTEDRVPTQHTSDDRYHQGRDRERARHQSYTSKSAPASAPRAKESSSRSTRYAKEDRARAEREKPRAKEVRPERTFVTPEDDSSADEKDRYEAAYKMRTEQERRKTEERRSYEDVMPAHRKMSAQAEEALRYQHKSRAQVEEEMARPSPQRAASRDYYNVEPRTVRRESSRPEPVRRSSARPGKDRPSVSRRDTDRTDRGIPEVMEWADERRTEERRPPTFKQSTSSPVELGRNVPQRSFTERLPRHAAESVPVPPAFHRSSTMPSVHSSSSRRKESAGPRPSGLRDGMTSEQYSSPERDTFPTVPPPQTPAGVKTTYYYPVSGGGVSVRPDELPTSAPRHVVREPKPRHRSPSPLGKPPIGANRPVEPTASYKTAPRPSMSSRTESARNISPIRGSEERGRSGRLYGEVGSDPRHRVRQPSYDPTDVHYSRRYGPEDVRWAPRSGEPDRGYASKPSINRTATYVY
ncbi:molecular chaperone [Pyrenophora seminiperda CCB06]|uniref:Molecular chaperone n=1 Tax=Pyrenophora seminiperda CCB06 TaxID=1302712 RepID=A0A3M7M5R2_9PLEO|nr:molecular chaperone [Pyrenophora seminiperda CCB06]